MGGSENEFVVDRLTGKRAMQKGKWCYEVKWAGTDENTYEPATNLVHYIKEMAVIDEKYRAAQEKPRLNPAAETQKKKD